MKGVTVMYNVLIESGVAEGEKVPSSLMLGSDAIGLITATAQQTIEQIKEWGEISSSIDFQSR